MSSDSAEVSKQAVGGRLVNQPPLPGLCIYQSHILNYVDIHTDRRYAHSNKSEGSTPP